MQNEKKMFPNPMLKQQYKYKISYSAHYFCRAVRLLSGKVIGLQPTVIASRASPLTGDARLEFLRNSARRLKMRERIERAG